ncbi:MAG: lytic transglycosylase domain-containing protein [Rubrobacter sp.]|nr:lytic transglycosylase domain-containing protein [Rubrobacter sp.]
MSKYCVDFASTEGGRDVRRVLFRMLAVVALGVALVMIGTGKAEAQTGTGADIPPAYLYEYQQTGAQYGLDWTILAAIGKVESNHGGGGGAYGCILGPPTPYGPAYGPMQFLESSWANSAVDGNGDGLYDSCNYQDAIPSSANYLIQNGAPGDYYSAIFAYNHADWYVQQVLAQAREYYQVYVLGY